MKIARFEWDGSRRARHGRPSCARCSRRWREVSEAVAAIIAEVERDGDAAVLRLEKRFGGAAPSVAAGRPTRELAAARTTRTPALLEALEPPPRTSQAVAAEAEAPATAAQPRAGQSVALRERPGRLRRRLRSGRPRRLSLHAC